MSHQDAAAPASSRVVVIKLGGSLLRLPDLEQRLRSILRTHENLKPLLVVGGGCRAEQVHGWQRQYHISDSAAHWLAVRAMAENAAQLQRLWRDTRLVTDRAGAHSCWQQDQLPLLHSEQFLLREQAEITRIASLNRIPPKQHAYDRSLPETWHVTSDAIAGWVARRWPASSLHLLKSCEPPTQQLVELSSLGLIDAMLPKLSGTGLSILWTDVQQATARIIPIRTAAS